MDEIGLFKLAHKMASHATGRQMHVARNVANADTPGYRATDLPDFATVMSDTAPPPMKATRPGHFGGSPDGSPRIAPVERGLAAAPNGNDVSVETEMVQAAGIRQSHDTAMSVLTTGRAILNAAIKPTR